MKPSLRTFALYLILIFSLTSCTYYFGNSWIKKTNHQPDEIPVPDRAVGKTKTQQPLKAHPLTASWADHELEGWGLHAKVSPPREIIAKLLMGREIKEVNAWLMEKEPWGYGGSTGPFSKNGDYDFTEIGLVQLLWFFEDQPELLYPETQRHIAEVLIVETGSKPRTIMPGTMRLFKGTENHILMKEFSRYLRNQWLYKHDGQKPEHNNAENGLEAWLLHHLEEMYETGFYEFNANPYLGYTYNALWTIHAYADSDELRQAAQKVLDRTCWQYALGSLDFRKYSPYRRRMERALKPELDHDPHSSIMTTYDLLSRGELVSTEKLPCCTHQAFMALVHPYRPPGGVLDLARQKPDSFFVRIGHGHKACPEIYSGGHTWLLTAGGTQRRKISQIGARPTSLMLTDGKDSITDCFHIQGKGKMGKWKLTGVGPGFAVAEGTVYAPPYVAVEGESGSWKVYKPMQEEELRVATWQGKKHGIIVVFDHPEQTGNTLAKALNTSNPDQKLLQEEFSWPNGNKITYDPNASNKKWIMKSFWNEATGKMILWDRDYDSWPRIQGYLGEML